MSDDVFIGAENEHNLFTVQRNTVAVSEEERGAALVWTRQAPSGAHALTVSACMLAARLAVAGRYHLGDHVNVIQKG